MTRLLLIEDEPGIRESLEDFFRTGEYSVMGVESGEEGLEAFASFEPTMILLDLRLPGIGGLDVLRQIRRRGSQVPVIILTARGEERQRIEGLQAGADDYVVKPFSLHELEARVEAILRRTGAQPEWIRIGECEVNLVGHEIRRGDRRERLVPREADLLAFLVRNPGRTFRREELLREVWGYGKTPSTRTVDTHVFQLRQKLEIDPESPRHLLTIHGVGYRLELESRPE